MTQILIELDKDEEANLRTSLQNIEGEIHYIDAKHLDGTLILQILATLNAATIPILGKIIIERIRANRHVIIKKDGVTVSGLSAEQAIKVLSELTKND